MLRGAWRIGRIAGIEIRIDPSWLIIAALITFNLWAVFGDTRTFPELSPIGAVAFAILSAVLFFGSVLAHELAHAGMSRLRKIPVSGITLFLFGGATHAEVDARGPLDEFLITVVGPLTSAALGAGYLLLRSALLPSLGRPLNLMLWNLGRVNIILALFNVLPGFPLDGGRLLRSALWRLLNSLSRATLIAARVGQVFGMGMVATGVFLAVKQGDVYDLWFSLIGWFLFRAASETLADGARRQILETTTVGQVMSEPPPAIPGGMPLAEALERFLMGHEGEAFPVVEDGRILGFVSLRTAGAAPAGGAVRDAVVPAESVVEAGPGERLDQVRTRMGRRGWDTVLVMDQGRLVGVIEASDLDRFLRSGPARPPQPAGSTG